MRILFLHTKYKERGGEDSVVESEIKLLQLHGHIVEPVYFDNAKHSFLNIWLLPFNPLSYLQVTRAIKRFKPDVIHLHNLHFGASFSVVWAAAAKHVPIVKTLHNYRFLCPSGTLFHNNELYLKSLGAAFPWRAVKDKVYRGSGVLTFWLAFTIWIHKKLGTFRKINRYITLNEKAKNIFLESDLKLAKKQVITKPNFIWSNPVSAATVRGNQFLYVGRLSPEKGVSVLLKAFASNGLPLVIIGDGPMRDEVIRCQQEHSNITWLGFQNKEVITEEMYKCNALIVPSVCLEGMPLTIVEGFAAATPVIASRLGAMETIVLHNNNGLLFTSNQADSLNRQIVKWNSFSGAKKNEFSRHAFHTYESKYTPQKNLSALLAIYHSALGTKPMQKAVKQMQLH